MKLIKTFFVYIIIIICATSFYAHQFFPNFSEKYTLALQKHKQAKKERNTKIYKIVDLSKNTKIYKDYIESKKKTDIAWESYKKVKNEERVFGFKSFYIFLERFGLTLCIFVYTLYNLLKSFFFERNNIGSKIIHSFMISVAFFYFYWIFQQFQDLNKTTYSLMTFLSAFTITIAIYFTTKYRKTTIQKLEKNNTEALNIIEKLELEVLTKQEKERARERQRISEELHDGILGKLFGTRLGLEFLDTSNKNDKKKYQVFLNELHQIETEIREVSHKLRGNLTGSDIDFITIIEQLLKDKSTVGNFNFNLEMDNLINWNSISKINRVNLYRIFQEALQNIIKHSKAKKVALIFLKKNNHIFIEIKDDGIGFNSLRIKNGIGITNIKSRVKRLKGTIDIDSKSNKGSILKIKIPYLMEEVNLNSSH